MTRARAGYKTGAATWRARLLDARADFVVWLGALYLPFEGAGAWSLDAMLARDNGPLYRRED